MKKTLLYFMLPLLAGAAGAVVLIAQTRIGIFDTKAPAVTQGQLIAVLPGGLFPRLLQISTDFVIDTAGPNPVLRLAPAGAAQFRVKQDYFAITVDGQTLTTTAVPVVGPVPGNPLVETWRNGQKMRGGGVDYSFTAPSSVQFTTGATGQQVLIGDLVEVKYYCQSGTTGC